MVILKRTAQFWVQYMDRIDLAVASVLFCHKDKQPGYLLFAKTLPTSIISMNHQNYAKYLSVYYIMLVNVPQQSQGLLQANGFSVSRSDMPASHTAADMTIEQTINKHAKTSGGIVGFSKANQHITHGVSQGIT
ncbi:hypothetical protein PoB_003054000 [Plakobranchus ocellatus]|uniref:Uncharacterized protein n=1 Tax=Plakobranchus ocellatus TaxID=259542 RepID=A0AAV4AB12_9GAST|nr:hypothetical protein PoB_003054000 [Plakobranchus ocellatus]